MSQESKLISSPLSSSGATAADTSEVRLKKAVALKDHAISKGITVSDSILKLLNEAECAAIKRDYLCANGLKIDQAISELTNFTYPTTGDTLIALTDPLQAQKVTDFKRRLPLWLLLAGVGFVVGYVLLQTTPPRLSTGNILIATSLGLLGSVMYQIFNTIGVIKEKAFSIDDIYSNSLRIYIGPVIGFLVYFALAQGALQQSDKLSNGLGIFLPFLAGFSTKLVVGILDKMVQAVMLAFGIEDKRADILVRQRRNQATAGTVPPGGESSTENPPEAIKDAEKDKKKPVNNLDETVESSPSLDETVESNLEPSDSDNEETTTTNTEPVS